MTESPRSDAEAMASKQREFDAFLGNMPQRLAAFTSNELPQMVRVEDGDRPFLKDYSAESLPGLERFLLSRFSAPAEIAQPGNQGFSEGFLRYLGEALMRATGGAWGFAPETNKGHGMPHFQADGPDGLLTGETVSLLGMIIQAVKLRTGSVFTDTLGHVRASFGPAGPTRSTSGFGVGARTRAEERFLANWNAELAVHTIDWITAQADPEAWDFGRNSLATLAAQVRARFDDTVELSADEAWLTGAACYVGQSFLRATSGEAVWCWGDPSRLDLDDPRSGRPYVGLRKGETGEDGAHEVPLDLLRATVQGSDEALPGAWDRMAAASGPGGT